jgi:hypothetical protein
MGANFVALIADYDGHVGDTALTQRRDLILQDRVSSDFEEALWSELSVREESASQPGRKNDGSHQLCLGIYTGLVPMLFEHEPQYATSSFPAVDVLKVGSLTVELHNARQPALSVPP